MFKKKPNESAICLICKNHAYFFCTKNGLRIYKCKHCGFGFTTQLKEQKGKYHRDETYIEEEDLFKNIFKKRIKIISKFQNSGKALEIGCSTGLMLSLLKDKGWDVLGIEISSTAAKVAKDRGIEVMTVPFEKANLNEKFDLIILNHTLEHLKDPLEVLKKAKSLLKPKGNIYLDFPNFESLGAKILKSNWPLLLPDEHLWHFSEKAVRLMFKSLDFKTIYIEKSSGIWDLDNPFKELLISLTKFKKRFFIEALTLIPSFIISKLKLGSDLLVIARKR